MISATIFISRSAHFANERKGNSQMRQAKQKEMKKNGTERFDLLFVVCSVQRTNQLNEYDLT
jgi:hypothetical protein